MNYLINVINDVLWGETLLLVYVLVAMGCWFTIRLGFLQVRHFKHMLGTVKKNKTEAAGISSFQALCTGLSARIGTGNLAGVALAISLGGSGAIFWMWVVAFLGMATGFAESVLGQVYKVNDSRGEFRGGPAYYIKYGLGNSWLAILFCICLFLVYGCSFSAMQSNTIVDALNYSYGFSPVYSGVIITVFACLIVVGGLHQIARFAELIVPFMSIAYIVIALVITILNIGQLPAVLYDIVTSAFGLQEAGAGALGLAVKYGIQRGLFSNEAGSGSIPHIAAAASSNPNHPAVQGFAQMLGVFIDTIVLCTCTAFIILLAGQSSEGGVEGIRITQAAMQLHMGDIGIHFVTIAVSLFAFTSIVANYAYVESNLHLLKLDNRMGRFMYTLIYFSMVLWGTKASLGQVWAFGDTALGLMTIVNAVAITLLTPTVIMVTKHYFSKINNKEKPSYSRDAVKVQGTGERSVW